MTHQTQTDAKTETRGRKVAQSTNRTTTIAVRTLPNNWIEITADLPGAGLEVNGVRLRGRVISIEAVRPRFTVGLNPQSDIEKITTRIVLRERPRGPIAATRCAGGSVLVRVPTSISKKDARCTTDGFGAIPADRFAEARHSNHEPLSFLSQAADVFPRRSGGVSAS